ncbi:MAG: NUDIX domain-containing protein [Pseudonocardia sp.]|nr:NUDIX domain-containing protein [Pseudonocardia sp.]MBO0875927.1 NUDIX domain-containing protein [Pseudonocardia sp.]
MVPCVGAVVNDHSGRLLLIRRGQPPGQGLWSLPGGRVEPGESDHQAVIREVAEETGLRVRPGRLLGTVHRPAPSGATYLIADYACELIGPDQPSSGTDAADARWVDAHDYAELPVVAGLTETLADWGVLPA